MGITRANVDRWVDAGIVDEATAERILAFEEERENRRATPSVAELFSYLAAAIVGAGVAVLVSTNWESLGLVARLGSTLIPAAAGLASGQVLRRSTRPELRRAASIAWLLSAALVSVAAAIVGVEAAWSEENVALLAAVVALTVTISLWRPLPLEPQLLGICGAVLLFSTALASRAEGDSVVAVLGLCLMGFGLGGLALTEAGLLVPCVTARILSGALMVAGAFWAGLDPAPAVLGVSAFAIAALLLVASIRCRTLTYTVFAGVAGFLGLITAILRHIENPTFAALSLIGTGIVLLIAIVLATQIKPWRSPSAGRGGAGGMAGQYGDSSSTPRPT
jgi:hypothetical protein